MKKLIFAVSLVLVLSGCGKNTTPASTMPEKTETPAATSTAAPTPAAKKIELTKNEGQYKSMNKAAECSYDMTHSGGAEENILLLTDAAYENGEFLWDDSQNWALVVQNDEGIYPLFENHMHGMAELSVSEVYTDSDVIPVIRLTISSSASYEIREYRYENGAFYEQIPYRAGGINEIPVETY